jgi:hypothetical protein
MEDASSEEWAGIVGYHEFGCRQVQEDVFEELGK